MRDLPEQIPEGLNPCDVITFSEADRVVDRFLMVMKHFGISINPQSELDQICETVADFNYRFQADQPVASDPALRLRAVEVGGLLTFLRKLVRLSGHAEFYKLFPHLHKLSSSRVPQTVKATDEKSNKIFELFIALICMEVGRELEVDDPDESSGGRNPDILFTFQNRRWGLACKVICGNSPLTLFDRIRDGITQIDRSEAELGLVMVNLKNAVDLDEVWPLRTSPSGELRTTAWLDGGAYVLDQLRDTVSTGRWQDLIDSNDWQNIEVLFRHSKALPVALAYLEAVTCIHMGEHGTLASFRMFHLWNLSRTPFAQPELLEQLNFALHDRFTEIDGAVS